MSEIKRKKTIAAIVVVLLASWFYWFQYRPMQVRNYCDQVAWNSSRPYNTWVDEEEYDWKYTQCLHSKGLK